MMSQMEKRLSKPKLGQHFLMHPRIAERIAQVARLHPGETVLEVGPGRGILTEALLARGGTVVAVEADASLIPELEERFHAAISGQRLVLIHADIREYLSSEHPQKMTTVQNSGYCVVANIPYYLTGELIRTLLSREHQPSSMTLLVQKEVAERIAREKKGSLLSLSVKAYGEPCYEFTVPRGVFRPAPSVDSAVMSIRDISRRHFKTSADEERFFAFIRAGFAHKRKYARSNLAAAGLSGQNLPEKVRAEDLSLADWLALARSG